MSETLLGVVDTYMVGQLGVAEIGAVGLGSMLAWLFYLPFLGLAMGLNTFVAQSYGAGKRKDCGYMTWQGLYMAVASGVLILLVIPFVPQLFELAGPSDEVKRLGITYLQWRLIDGPAFMVAMTAASFFRGIGDTKTPMKIGITINIINVILNYGLIYGHFGIPRLEVQGSAMGSALAGMLGGGIYLVLYLSRRLRHYENRTVPRPRWLDQVRLLKVGAPIGLQRFLDIGSFVIFAAIIGRLGNAQLAANQIAIQLMSISYMIGLGIGMAAATLVGQYIGAKRIALAERSAYSALKLAMSIMVFVGLAFLLFPEPLVSPLQRRSRRHPLRQTGTSVRGAVPGLRRPCGHIHRRPARRRRHPVVRRGRFHRCLGDLPSHDLPARLHPGTGLLGRLAERDHLHLPARHRVRLPVPAGRLEEDGHLAWCLSSNTGRLSSNAGRFPTREWSTECPIKRNA